MGGLEAGVEAGLEACFEQVAQGLWLESSSTQQNHITPREARTPDLEVNSLTL